MLYFYVTNYLIILYLNFKSVHCIQKTDSLENYRIDIPSFFS